MNDSIIFCSWYTLKVNTFKCAQLQTKIVIVYTQDFGGNVPYSAVQSMLNTERH